MESPKSAMEDSGPQRAPKKTSRGGGVHTHTHDTLGLRVDESMCVSQIKEGNQYKF